jgi:hypothetical protein
MSLLYLRHSFFFTLSFMQHSSRYLNIVLILHVSNHMNFHCLFAKVPKLSEVASVLQEL